MRIFDNFIPGRGIWKDRVNCRLCGTINIISWNNINIDEYAIDGKNINHIFRLVKSRYVEFTMKSYEAINGFISPEINLIVILDNNFRLLCVGISRYFNGTLIVCLIIVTIFSHFSLNELINIFNNFQPLCISIRWITKAFVGSINIW